MRNQSAATQVTRSPNLLADLGEAKSQLRLYHDDLDKQVLLTLEAATAHCEQRTNRILREASTIEQHHDGWASIYRLDWEPAIEVTSLEYYDLDGVLQTVPAENVRLTTSSNSSSCVELDSLWTRPSLQSRELPIVLMYTAGYTELPKQSHQAILLMTQVLFGDLDDRQVAANRRAAMDLLATTEWGVYR